ncbi:MAG: CheR family methyltransferase [bacterium]
MRESVTRPTPDRWSDLDYNALQVILRRRSGLVFQPLRRIAIEGAANRVMRNVGLQSPEAFLPLVHEDGAVFDDLMAEVTIGETYFFREQSHFSLLRRTIVPEFRARAAREQKFRAWSAACSTGEEPYSIALTLREENVPCTVVGTDVSRARLGAARRGEYRAWSFRGVPQQTIARYFTRSGDDYLLGGDVRRDVEFRYLNLASDHYPAMSTGVWGMDLILCRNVLIYFDRETIAHVAGLLLASLAADGWLLLGATDPPLHEFVQCEVVRTDAGLAYRHLRHPGKPSVGSVAAILQHLPSATAAPQPLVPAAPAPQEVKVAPTSTASPIQHPVSKSDIGRSVADATPTNAYTNRDYEQTIELIAASALAGTATPTDVVLGIRSLANLGRLEDAGRACAAALDRFREHAELHYLHAVLVAQAGHLEESARAAKRALYLDRSMIVAHLALGSALAGSGDSDGALRSFAASERLLSAMTAEALVPGTDGEPAGRLLEMTRVQAALARRVDAT